MVDAVNEPTEFRVGDVARLAHVSVRTLHHYDEIGTILTDPNADAADHLRRQHRLLRERIARGQQLLHAIEKEMEARQMGISLTPEEQFEIFGTDKVSGEWADEAQRRWGETDQWAQSQRKTAGYTKADWIEIQSEASGLNQAMRQAMTAGEPATGERAMQLAEAHRQHIIRWFYDCSHQLHRCLGEMYLDDERFRKNYDDIAPGLAQYFRDAMVANADRAQG